LHLPLDLTKNTLISKKLKLEFIIHVFAFVIIQKT